MHLDLAKYVKEGWVNHMKYIVVGLGVKKYLDLSQDLAFIFVLSTASNITLPKKVHLVKAMVFPVVMYGCESLTVKKAEHRRIDAFGLWCWRRLLRVPWTARRSNQSLVMEIGAGFLWKE